MGAKVKCKICKNTIEKSEAYLHERVSEKTKKVYREYHCSESEYIIYHKAKEELNELRSQCFTFIHDDVLQLEENQLVPLYITKRVGELAKGYPYQVIRGTFKRHLEAIKYAILTKGFTSDYNKARYIMAIIDSNINDVYYLWKQKLKQESVVKKEVDVINMQTYNQSVAAVPKTTVSNGIDEFLSEDDL